MNWLSPATVDFLTALRENNDRDWFAEHKADHETALKHPGEHFAAALAGELSKLTGKPHDYRVFRIHRDVRFAKDKTPYNAHLHISLSPGGSCREGGPGWMVGLDPDGLALGAGIFAFSPAQLAHWRDWCGGEKGQAVGELMSELVAMGARIPDPELKRVPAPWPADHLRTTDLRRKGLTAWFDRSDPAIAFGPEGPARCVAELAKLRPLFDRLAVLG